MKFLKELLTLLNSDKKIIIAMLILSLAITSLILYLRPHNVLVNSSIELVTDDRPNAMAVRTEIEKLQSRTFIANALERVDFANRYYRRVVLKEIDIHGESPFEVQMTKGYDFSFFLTPQDATHYRLKAKGVDADSGKAWSYDEVLTFGTAIKHPAFELTVKRYGEVAIDDTEYRFIVLSESSMVDEVKKKIEISQQNNSSIITVSYHDAVVSRAESVVDAIVSHSINQNKNSSNSATNRRLMLADFRIAEMESLANRDGNESNITDLDRVQEMHFQKSMMVAIKQIQNSLVEQEKEKLTEKIKQNSYKIIDDIYTSPVAELSATLIYLYGIIVGLLFSIFIVILRARWDNSIKSPAQIREQSRVPLLATIPHVARGMLALEVMDDPRSHFAKSFRVLRDALAYISHEDGARVISITSAVGGEGKVTLCANLAATLSQTGQMVILLDLDMEVARLHKSFRLENKIGMSSVLSHTTTIANVIQHSAYENLDVVSSGSIPPNPEALIEGKRMKDVIEKLKSVYDIILINAPSVNLVREEGVLMGLSDITLYLLRAGVTPKSLIADMDTIYKSKSVRGFGVVLNDAIIEDTIFDDVQQLDELLEESVSSVD